MKINVWEENDNTSYVMASARNSSGTDKVQSSFLISKMAVVYNMHPLLPSQKQVFGVKSG